MSVETVSSGEARWAVIEGDNLATLATMPDASVDAVVCDPPYELGFMNRKWDASGVAYDVSRWSEVFRVLKPGGHLLAFGGTRTYHRMACAIEDAGFEIRDSIDWIYGSGFPKSHDISKAIDREAGAERKVIGTKHLTGNAGIPTKEKGGTYGVGVGTAPGIDVPITAPATPEAIKWDGWGTALKPAHEPIIMARKPLEGTVAGNVTEHGTGGINVDACRIGTGEDKGIWPITDRSQGLASMWGGLEAAPTDTTQGRWPANVLFGHSPTCDDSGCVEGCPVKLLGEQSGESVSSARVRHNGAFRSVAKGAEHARDSLHGHNDAGTAARYFAQFDPDPVFYAPKANRTEREAGCESLPARSRGEITGRDSNAPGCNSPRSGKRAGGEIRNSHPTVKPIQLMRWLVRLVTPPGGIVLDPYAGSGSTGCACVLEGFRFIGLELEPAHVAIANARIAWWEANPEPRVRKRPKLSRNG